MSESKAAIIPIKNIGPIKIIGAEVNDAIKVPLATLEKPLWPSVKRGARAANLSGGILATVIKDCMTRSVLLQAPDAAYAAKVVRELEARQEELAQIVTGGSRFAKLEAWQTQIVGDLLFIRFSLQTGDAAGHNMVTKAADELLTWIIAGYPKLQYVSVSGNYCVDKKVSAVNGILGRGKYVVAEVTIPGDICEAQLKATPEQIVALNNKKNLIGSIISGGVRSANAHFANMLLAFYLATGQDAANIVEGSQGIVYAEQRQEDLYFSVTIPNIIVGTIGSGKDLDFVKNSLDLLGCLEPRAPGQNSRRLAVVAAATVLCGELSLLAAQTKPGELVRSHMKLERKY